MDENNHFRASEYKRGYINIFHSFLRNVSWIIVPAKTVL